MTNYDKLCFFKGILAIQNNVFSVTLYGFRETDMIISRFRNYTRFRNYDSETTIRKLFRAIQKLIRAIRKLRLGNYCVRLGNYD
jgi:hypothetical protein